jgi:hypothetical protein
VTCDIWCFSTGIGRSGTPVSLRRSAPHGPTVCGTWCAEDPAARSAPSLSLAIKWFARRQKQWLMLLVKMALAGGLPKSQRGSVRPAGRRIVGRTLPLVAFLSGDCRRASPSLTGRTATVSYKWDLSVAASSPLSAFNLFNSA